MSRSKTRIFSSEIQIKSYPRLQVLITDNNKLQIYKLSLQTFLFTLFNLIFRILLSVVTYLESNFQT